MKSVGCCCMFVLLTSSQLVWGQDDDPRNFANARQIPDESYCDQPYIVTTSDGDWVCTMTTGPHGESGDGQHIAATISEDQGRSWSPLIDVEPSSDIKSSWAVPLTTPSGRIYVFYNYNGDRVHELNGEKLAVNTLLGWYVYKYSDDGGRNWSDERFRLPMPVAEVDRNNEWQGKVQLFWGIDKPMIDKGTAFFAFTRMGEYVHDKGEGWLYRSSNLLTESDPAEIQWELLPRNGRGIRNDALGSIQEEHNIVALSGESLFCIYRTTKGYPAAAYSRDRGETWSQPEFAVYQPGGRKIQSPRACPMVWKTSDGRYLLWFHNTTLQLRSKGRWRKDKALPVTGRDLVWLSAGVEQDGFIVWSQPELISYTTDGRGISYPDMIESDRQYYFSATNKRDARIIAVDRELVENLWDQRQLAAVAQRGLVLHRQGEQVAGELEMPPLPDPSRGGGFTLDLRFKLQSYEPGQVLLDSRTAQGQGILLKSIGQNRLQLAINDGRNRVQWKTDPQVLTPGKWHHLSVIVDGGPKMITGVVDSQLCDGEDDPNCYSGQSRFLDPSFDQPIGDVTGGPTLRVAPTLDGTISDLRIYNRYLRTSEAIGNAQSYLASPE